MTGRAEVTRLQQQLDSSFARAGTVTHDLELQADLAKFLCVQVSGFLENAVVELLLEHTRTRAATSVHQHVESTLRRFTNAKAQKIIQLMGSFTPDWRKDLEAFIVDEKKAAVDSVVDLRNTIAHGRSVGVTLIRAREYYAAIKQVVERIATLCA